MRMEKRTVRKQSKYGSSKIGTAAFCQLLFANCIINGIAAKKMVMAGVGRPINESDCRVSRLNLARRKSDSFIGLPTWRRWELERRNNSTSRAQLK